MATEQDAKQVEIGEVFGANAYFEWSMQGVGFGQLSFGLIPGTGEITCSNECMSRERVRAILHAFADHVADKATLLG